ncbi:LysR family transcriptional regulator [Pseudonocardia spinosispora]|uniref:LysR family transcriptional regulator n=1 Tax=Pseudonocardia spinosispora TaxID=103441 RepID=UPI00040BBE25|nr:LysR family transcriptional regulator [Pseudonocardia spinosispora]
MELRQFVYFDAVVRHGGFTRAAEQLRVAQPAVSAQLRKLEAELGVTLLERTTRRVRLTRAGELVLGRARRVFEELDGVRDDLALLAGELRGRVRIGSIQATGPFRLAEALAAFHREFPDVELSLTAGRLAQLITDLDDDVIDLAIGPLPGGRFDRIVEHPLFDDELVLITAPEHPLAGRDGLPLSAVRDEVFACLPAESGLRRRLDDACAAAGFAPTVRYETTIVPQLRELVSHGLGVALLARSVAEAPGPQVAVHPISPSPISRPVGVLHLRDRPLGPAARRCHRFLTDWADAGKRP